MSQPEQSFEPAVSSTPTADSASVAGTIWRIFDVLYPQTTFALVKDEVTARALARGMPEDAACEPLHGRFEDMLDVAGKCADDRLRKEYAEVAARSSVGRIRQLETANRQLSEALGTVGSHAGITVCANTAPIEYLTKVIPDAVKTEIGQLRRAQAARNPGSVRQTIHSPARFIRD